MLRFLRSPHRWWQKPLVRIDGRDLPAELAIAVRLRAATTPSSARG
jgi:hypothetical protein